MTRTLSFVAIACAYLTCTTGCGSSTASAPTAPTAVQSATAAATPGTGVTTSTNTGTSSTNTSPTPTPSPSAPDDDRELEGLVTAIPPTTAPGQFTVNGTTVRTTPTTTITLNGHTGLFTDLLIGARVHVKSTANASTGAFTATAVMIQNQTPTPPPPATDDDDDSDDDGTHGNEVELRGVVAAVTGACPVIQFTVTGTTAVTTASTRFDLACSSVVATRAVEVHGTRAADGTVTATRVKRQ